MQVHLDPLILGSNPLVGVDHFISSRAIERNLRLNESARAQVFRAARNAGATGFTFTVTAETCRFLKVLDEAGDLDGISLYPLVPDDQLASTAAKDGVFSAISGFLEGQSLLSKVRTYTSGGASVVFQDPVRAIKTYLSGEVERVRVSAPSAKVPALLLQESPTDLAAAFQATDLLTEIHNHLLERCGVVPGYQTRNFARFVSFFDSCGLNSGDAIFMAPFNPIGFQMTPSREECESSLYKLRKSHVVAISILAGGRCTLAEAIEYLRGIKGIAAVAVGVSSINHATETFRALGSSSISTPGAVR